MRYFVAVAECAGVSAAAHRLRITHPVLSRQIRDASADSLVARAEAIGAGRTGVLRVGATPQTLESVLAGFLRRYRRVRPGIEVRLVEDAGPGVLARLERGEVHLGITLAGRPCLAP